MVELLADEATAKRVKLVARIETLRWKFVEGYDLFSDSLKKSAETLPENIRKLRNLEIVRHRMNLCTQHTRNEEAVQWYKAQKAKAEALIETLSPEGADQIEDNQEEDAIMKDDKPRAQHVDDEGFTLVTRRRSQQGGQSQAPTDQV